MDTESSYHKYKLIPPHRRPDLAVARDLPPLSLASRRRLAGHA
jgi:hypothetical protein